MAWKNELRCHLRRKGMLIVDSDGGKKQTAAVWNRDFFLLCTISFFSGAEIGRKFRLWLTERETWGKTLWAAAAATVAGTTWGHRFFSFHHHQHHVGKITWFRKVVEKGRVAFSRVESYLMYAYYTFFSSSPKTIFIIILLYHTNNSFWCFWLGRSCRPYIGGCLP